MTDHRVEQETGTLEGTKVTLLSTPDDNGEWLLSKQQYPLTDWR